MIQGYIRLSDVMLQMENVDGEGKNIPFDVKFVTYDAKRNIGGKLMELKDVRKCVGKRGKTVVFGTSKSENLGSSKNPHHWENATRNILLKNGQIRKLHIRLIIEFNGQKVCY